jgi:hypothetical protein
VDAKEKERKTEIGVGKMDISTRPDFHLHLRQEAHRLLSYIKQETNKEKKYQLCGMLMEIYEELDIEVRDNLSFWGDIQVNYQDFVNHVSS